MLASTLRIAVACAAMGAVAWGLAGAATWEDGAQLADYAWLAGALGAAGLAYLAVAWLLRAPELDAVLGRVTRRLRRRQA